MEKKTLIKAALVGLSLTAALITKPMTGTAYGSGDGIVCNYGSLESSDSNGDLWCTTYMQCNNGVNGGESRSGGC